MCSRFDGYKLIFVILCACVLYYDADRILNIHNEFEHFILTLNHNQIISRSHNKHLHNIIRCTKLIHIHTHIVRTRTIFYIESDLQTSQRTFMTIFAY